MRSSPRCGPYQPERARISSAPLLRRGALLIRGPSYFGGEWVPALRSSAKNAAPRPGHADLHSLHAAPFRDEQRGGLGRLPQGVEIDIFVEAVRRSTAGAEAQARNIVVQPVEPRVGERGEHEVSHSTAIDRVERLAKRSFSFSGILQLIAVRQKPGPFHVRRIVGEEAMIARGSRDAGQDLW